jgi:hypothetical protein
VDIRNSQRRSPRSLAKSKQDSSGAPGTIHRPLTEAEEKQFMDFSGDHVARVRAAKAAAQREMESFGDPSEYDVVILQGQLKEEPVAPSQPPLNFPSDAADEPGETD